MAAKKKYRLKWRNSIRNSHQCAIPSQNKRRTNDTNEKEKMENRNSFYIVAKPHVVYFILIRRKFPYKFHNSIQFQWSFYRLSKKFQQNWIQKAKINYKETYRFFFGWPLILITIFRSQLNEGQRCLPFPTQYSHFY